MSPEWRCPLNRGVTKERFHCINQPEPIHVAGTKHLNSTEEGILRPHCPFARPSGGGGGGGRGYPTKFCIGKLCP